MDKIVNLKPSGDLAKKIMNIEKEMEILKLKEEEVKKLRSDVLYVLKEKDIKKAYVDDEGEKLLAVNFITSSKRDWNEKAIRKTLTEEQLKQVVKKKIVEEIDYNMLADMVIGGNITEEQYNAMYKETTSEYIKVAREKRDD